MSKKIAIIILPFLFISNLFSQTNFYKFNAKADSLYKAETYLAAAQYYDKAFNENKKIATKWNYYHAACAWAASGQEETKAIQYLNKAIQKRMFDWNKIDTTSQFIALKKHTDWEKTKQYLIAEQTKFEQGLNLPLKEKLEKIAARDQVLRKLMTSARKELEGDTMALQYYFDLMKNEDSICQVQVLQILDTYGWIGISEVGEKANTAIWLVIQHAPLEIQEKYYPMMKTSVEKEESSGSNFAYLIDRIRMRKNEKQVYGSQYKYNRVTKKRYFYPIEDYKNVNKRREAVGLMPIEEYARLIHLEYDPSIWEK